MSHDDKDRVLLGRVVGFFGVKGWVKVFSFTDPREAILKYKTWWLGDGEQWSPVSVRDGRKQGKSVIALLGDADDRDSAAGMLEAEIAIQRSSLPAAGDDQFYWSDLEGLAVERTNGEALGRVAYILETGANDVLVVQGDTEILVPFLMNDTIVDVDLNEQRIIVDWEWDG